MSGDIDNDNVLDADNAYHVVLAQNLDEDLGSRLNGLTIRHGYASGSGALASGAGLWVRDSTSILVIRCRFTANYAANSGGAVVLDGPPGPTDPPSAHSSQFLACTFDNNVSENRGGAISINGFNSVCVMNSLAYDNETGSAGGAFIFIPCGALNVFNCTSTRNFTNSSTLGAIHTAFEQWCGNAGIINSVIYGNSNSSGSLEKAQISFDDIRHISVYNSDIQNLGYFSGQGNVDVDPLFVDANNDDSASNTSPKL